MAGEITKGGKEVPLEDGYAHYLDCGDGVTSFEVIDDKHVTSHMPIIPLKN